MVRAMMAAVRGKIAVEQRGIAFYPRAWRVLFAYNVAMVMLLVALPSTLFSWLLGVPNLFLAPAALDNGRAWWKTALIGAILLVFFALITIPRGGPSAQPAGGHVRATSGA